METKKNSGSKVSAVEQSEENSFQLIDSNSFFTVKQNETAEVEATISEMPTLEVCHEEAHTLDLKLEPSLENTISNEPIPKDFQEEVKDQVKPKPSISHIRSYANILSEGLTMVRNVFKQKTKDEAILGKEIKKINKPAEKVIDSNVSESLTLKHPNPNAQDSKTLDIQLGIPGLLFKQDLERRNSKKKRKSRVLDENLDITNENQQMLKENHNISEHPGMSNLTEDMPKVNSKEERNPNSKENKSKEAHYKPIASDEFVEILSESAADIDKSQSSKNATLKRRLSKKKKEVVEKKFKDDIDQALHEIMVMEEELRTKENSIKSKRPSKKGKYRKFMTDKKSELSGTLSGDGNETDLNKINLDENVPTFVSLPIVKKYSQRQDTLIIDDTISNNSDEITCLEDEPLSPADNYLDEIVSPLGIQEDLKEKVFIEALDKFDMDKEMFTSSNTIQEHQYLGDHEETCKNTMSTRTLNEDAKSLNLQTSIDQEAIKAKKALSESIDESNLKKESIKISTDWMIDDVGTIESSDEEMENALSSEESRKITPNKSLPEMSSNLKANVLENKRELDIKDDHITMANDSSKTETLHRNISNDWMIDDVGTIELSDEEENTIPTSKEKIQQLRYDFDVNQKPEKEENIAENVKSLEGEKNNKTNKDNIELYVPDVKVEEKICKDDHKPDISDDWMNDDVGVIESSDEEENVISQTNSEVKVDEKGENKIVRPEICDDWMDDDVGIIESSDEEENVVPQTSPEVKVDEKGENKNVRPEISDDWMVDDVGIIESSDEEEDIIPSIKEVKIDKKQEKGKVSHEISNDWMNDDVGTMELSESDDDNISAKSKINQDEVRLALPQPTYSSIAAKEVSSTTLQDEQKKPDAVISVPGPHVTLIVAADEHLNSKNNVDEDGYQPVVNKKERQTRKFSDSLFASSEDLQKSEAISQKDSDVKLEQPGKEISDSWMIDDVVTIESSDDEEENIKPTIKSMNQQSKTEINRDLKNCKNDQSQEISDDWMIDDVGIIESSDEEEVDAESNISLIQGKLIKSNPITKTKSANEQNEVMLALPQPTYSSIAAKEVSSNTLQEEQKKPDSVISIPGPHVTLIVDADEHLKGKNNDEHLKVGTCVDEEGYEQVFTKKEKIIMKISTNSLSEPGASNKDEKKNTEVKNERKTYETEQQEHSRTEISKDWMIDDVGCIESSDEEEIILKEGKNLIFGQNVLNKSESKAIKKISLESSFDWMIDEPVQMNSSDEDSDGIVLLSLPTEHEKSAIKSETKLISASSKSTLRIHHSEPGEDTGSETLVHQEAKCLNENCYSPTCNGKRKCYSSLCKHYEITHIETDGRGSAMSEAQRFSCDDEQFDEFQLQNHEPSESAEETSWAFVVSNNKNDNMQTESPEPQKLISKETPCPPLVIEIVEKEERKVQVDSEGYTCVKTKHKSKKKIAERKELPIDLINKLDQPLCARPYKEEPMVFEEELTEDESGIEPSTDRGIINAADLEIDSSKTSNQCVINTDTNELVNSDDPWLAVKEEYVRPEIDVDAKTGYLIDVKISTKETCLGRKLHASEAQEWKMDVQCVQHDSCPDIIERSVGCQKNEQSSGSSRLNEKSLAPSWMRKAVTENEKQKSMIKTSPFGEVVSKNKSELAGKEKEENKVEEKQVQPEEEVYWRIKNKVKKKRRRTTSNTSCGSDPTFSDNSNSNSLSRKDLKDSQRPVLSKIPSESVDIKPDVSNYQTLFDSEVVCIEEDSLESPVLERNEKETLISPEHAVRSMELKTRKISTCKETNVNEFINEIVSDKESMEIANSVMESKDEDYPANLNSDVVIHIDETDSQCTESKMLDAVEMDRVSSPIEQRIAFNRQTSREMEEAFTVQRPLRKVSTGDKLAGNQFLTTPATTSFAGLPVDDSCTAWMNDESIPMESSDEEDLEIQQKAEETHSMSKKRWAEITSKVIEKNRAKSPKQSRGELPSVKPIIVCESDEKEKDILIDEDGFEVVESKISKRSRKITEQKNDEKLASDTTSLEAPCDKNIKASETRYNENKERKQDFSEVFSTKPENIHFLNYSKESFWLDKSLYDDAENKFFSKPKPKMGTTKKPSNDKKDDDDEDDVIHKKKMKKNTTNIMPQKEKSSTGVENQDLSMDTYCWTDESTYLSPKISLLAPSTILMDRISDFSTKPFLQVSFDPAIIEIKVCTQYVRSIEIFTYTYITHISIYFCIFYIKVQIYLHYKKYFFRIIIMYVHCSSCFLSLQYIQFYNL